MKKIIAHISLNLVLGCSMMSFGMDRKEPWISQGKLIKYSYSRKAYKPLNTNQERYPTVSVENSNKGTVITKHGTLVMGDNRLFVKTENDVLIPIEGSMSLNKLHFLKLFLINGKGHGNLKAIDTHGNQHIITKMQIPWDELSSIKKTMCVFSACVRYPINENTVIHKDAIMEFLSNGTFKIRYSKQYAGKERSVIKLFRRDVLPFNASTNSISALLDFQANEESFILKIEDTENEDGKTTFFEIKEISGTDEDIRAYNVQETTDTSIETDQEYPSHDDHSLIKPDPRRRILLKKIEKKSEPEYTNEWFRRIHQIKQAIIKKISDHPIASILGMGAIVTGIIGLLIAHYTDYLQNIDITHMLNKFVSSKKS